MFHFRIWITAAVGCVSTLLSVSATRALTFNFTSDASNPPSAAALAGFNEAAGIWSGILNDSVTLNYTLSWQSLSPGVIGSASSERSTFAYTSVRSTLIADATSTDDTNSSGALPAGSVPLMINRTSEDGGSATPRLDDNASANNTTLRLTRANAKALGLVGATDAGNDATITFSSSFAFDFDRTDGIDGDKMDFVGVALHEIGHSLGFTSGVDILDQNSPPNTGLFSEDAFTWVNTLDLFRFSDDSAAQDAIDFSASNTDKWLSTDFGATRLTGVKFSTGREHGDGQQASHFKDSLGLGLLDPTTGFGERIDPGDNDERALDVIGWDLASALGSAVTESFSVAGSAPEPAHMTMLGTLAVLVHLAGRRRR